LIVLYVPPCLFVLVPVSASPFAEAPFSAVEPVLASPFAEALLVAVEPFEASPLAEAPLVAVEPVMASPLAEVPLVAVCCGVGWFGWVGVGVVVILMSV